MSQLTLEQRVMVLERKVTEIESHASNGQKKKPWLSTLGMFGDDEGMKEIFDEAMKIREKDRQRARRRYAKKGAATRKSKGTT
jgi:hypothetical protein